MSFKFTCKVGCFYGQRPDLLPPINGAEQELTIRGEHLYETAFSVFSRLRVIVVDVPVRQTNSFHFWEQRASNVQTQK